MVKDFINDLLRAGDRQVHDNRVHECLDGEQVEL